jgi:hypothetical protein
MSRTLLMVGTRKGLWIGTSDESRRDWSWTGPHFPMEEVYSVMVDRRGEAPPRGARGGGRRAGPPGGREDPHAATGGGGVGRRGAPPLKR